jgi:hypothetical protein
MNTFTKNAARLLKGVAALSVAAAGLALAPFAQAQSGTVSLTNCSATNGAMTGFTWNGSVLSVTCSAGTVDPGPGTGGTLANDPLAGTFTVVQCNSWTPFSSPVTASAGSTFSACIIRQNGWIGAYTVPYTAAGASPASGSVSFNDKDGTPRQVNITLPSAAGTVTLQVGTPVPTASNGLTTTAGGSVTINVQGAPVVTPPATGNWQTDAAVPQLTNCTTNATSIPTWFTYNSQKQLFTLQTGQTGAIPFIAVGGTNPFVQSTETTSTPASADNEVSISQCPGDFSQPLGACRADYSFNGGTVYMTTGPSPYYCNLQPGNKYYINVRQVFRNSTTPSCPAGALNGAGVAGCDVKLQIQGLN